MVTEASRSPPQRHRRGPIGTGSRNLPHSKARARESELRGKAVRAREPPGLAWDNINAGEAGSRSEKRLAQADGGSLPPSQRLFRGPTQGAGGRPQQVCPTGAARNRPPVAAPLLLLAKRSARQRATATPSSWLRANSSVREGAKDRRR